MAQTPELFNVLRSRDFDFAGGANSFVDPSKLNPNQYRWAENTQNDGFDISTRQGWTNLLKFSCGRSQGIALFKPSNMAIPNLYIAISGEIWISFYPFTTAQRLPGIQFRPDVDMVTFCEATVANSPSAAVTPYRVLMMQDGITRAAYTDGTVSRHLDPTPNAFYTPFSIGARETRIGLAMEFVGGRLWVANGRQLFASDIFDPLHFIETTYLAGGGSFLAYDGDIITCLKRTADGRQLLIGTIGNTTALDAGNTDRASWASDPQFERLLFPGVGWVGPKCSTELNAELFWMSKEGARFYNVVGSAAFSARRAISSNEMKKSFDNQAPVLSRCCAGAFESYGLMGFPSGNQYNRHIWAINTSGNDLLNSQSPYSWQPIWKGIRPVEFTSNQVNGENRIFALEQGRDIPRVWELFGTKRRDYYQLGGLQERSIQCRLETRGHMFGEYLSFKRFSYADLHLKKVFGAVTLNAQYKNEYGCYRDFGDWNLCTTQCVTLNLTNCNLNPPPSDQSRYLKTEEPQAACNEGGSPYQTNVGTFFTFQFTWTGEMAFRGVNYFATQFPESTKGACETGDDTCIDLSCCESELEYWSSPEEFFPLYYYDGSCQVMEVTDG